MRGGIDRSVAVDMACARATHRAGMKVGHLGHLHAGCRAPRPMPRPSLPPGLLDRVQRRQGGRSGRRRQRGWLRAEPARPHPAPRATPSIAAMRAVSTPATSLAVADAARRARRRTLRRHHHLPGAAVRPRDAARSCPTPNLATLDQRRRGAGEGRPHRHRDQCPRHHLLGPACRLWPRPAPRRCEPGNGLHGTTALHAVEDLPELPAVLYLTEVSHLSGGKAYCFGGGFYIDPIFPDYDVKAIVADEPTTAACGAAQRRNPAARRHRLLRA